MSEKAQTCRFCQHSRREKTKLCTFSSLSVIIYYVIMTLLLLLALWHWLIIALIVFCVFHRHNTDTHTGAHIGTLIAPVVISQLVRAPTTLESLTRSPNAYKVTDIVSCCARPAAAAAAADQANTRKHIHTKFHKCICICFWYL